MNLTRRSFLTQVTVGVAGLPLMGGLSWAQVKGKLGYMKIVDNAALFMAMEKGFFKAEGLELETLPLAGGAPIINGVVSGDLQFGWTNVISLYQARVEGFDFKLIAGGATNVKAKNESHAIQVTKNSPLKTAKDLEGKTVAVNTLNNIVHLMAMAWIDKNGGSSSKVKFVEVPFPQMEATLSAGKIDAISVHEPFATAAIEKGGTRVLAQPWGDVLPKFLIASWFASEKWLAKNKETGQAFVRAIGRGIDAIQADPEGSRTAMVKWAGLNPDLARKIGLPVFEKGISEKDLQATIDLTLKYKLIAKAFQARDVISDLAPKG
jgi:NitT/TauT family transport system substrate-binding protein